MPTNAEIVTAAVEGFDEADMAKFTARWARQIVFDTSNYDGLPLDESQARGAEEVVMVFGRFMSSFRSLEIVGVDVTEVGDRHVLAVYDEVRREHGSDEPLVRHNAIVFELREGEILHVWVFTDPQRGKAFSREVSG